MASGCLSKVFLDDLKIIETPMVIKEAEMIARSVSLLRFREIAQHQNRLGAFKSWVCSFLACTFLLLPAFASALVEVEFSNGFFGTVGQNTQKADSISMMSDYGFTEIKLQQDLGDGASIFQLQGNDIPIDLVLTQGSGAAINLNAVLTSH
jgi:hypothetical protein